MLPLPKLPKKSLTKNKKPSFQTRCFFCCCCLSFAQKTLFVYFHQTSITQNREVKYYILSIFYSFWTRKMRKKENPKYQKEKCLKMKWIASHLTMTFSGWTRTSKNSRRRRSSSIHVVILKKKDQRWTKNLKHSILEEMILINIIIIIITESEKEEEKKIPGNISEMMMELKAINFSFLFFFILIPTTIFIQTHTFFIETKWNDLVEQNIVVLVGWLVGWWNEIEQFLLKIHF